MLKRADIQSIEHDMKQQINAVNQGRLMVELISLCYSWYTDIISWDVGFPILSDLKICSKSMFPINPKLQLKHQIKGSNKTDLGCLFEPKKIPMVNASFFIALTLTTFCSCSEHRSNLT